MTGRALGAGRIGGGTKEGFPPPALIVLGAILSALLVGALMGANAKMGIGLLLALVYVPLVLINLPLGLALWMVLTFVAHFSAVSIGPNAAGLMVALGWLGTLSSRRQAIREVLLRHRPLIAVSSLFFVWVSLSPAFAAVSASVGYDDVGLWFEALLTLLVVGTTVATRTNVRTMFWAFAVGAALSVAAGIPGGGLTANANDPSLTDGRFSGGGGDPNYLAAGLVPAIVLSVSLMTQIRDPILRWTLTCLTILSGVGLAATESRGGLIAAAVATMAAFVLAKRKAPAIAGIVGVIVVAGAFFAAQPSALQRTTDFKGGGTGRTELWGIAWKLWKEHPVTGIGLDNFRQESFRFARKQKNLHYVRYIAERPDHVHNTYLEVLCETGIVGFTLLLAVIAGCLRAAWLAMKRFDASGDEAMAGAARAVIVASLAILTASFFLSNETDLRMWTLLGLGPALLTVAVKRSNERPGEALPAPA
jgi:O-antigen ligase